MMTASALDAQAMGREEELGDEGFLEAGNVAKGVSWAISIEGGAALLFYAVWHLWHVWR